MDSADLYSLWKLHLVDTAIVEIKAKAAALDPGRALIAEIQRLEALDATIGGKARTLEQERLDLELANQSLDEKIKHFDRQLYGGTVVNSKEAANIEKEIDELKRRRSTHDDRLLELYEIIPPAQKEADEITRQINIRKKQLEAHQAKQADGRKELEQSFASNQSRRAGLAAKVPSDLLQQYEALRKRTGGIGMAEVNADARCSACGVQLPERVVVMTRESKFVQCEQCRRILFRVMPTA